MRLNASTHPERRRRGRSLATIVAVAALTAALQAGPAAAMVSDEGIGVCERVPGIEGGWNFTTGQPCTLAEDAGGRDDSDGPIWVEATPNPNAIVGEPIYVQEPKAREPEPKLKQLCRDVDCARKAPGRSAADRDHFGSPDGPKRGSLGKKGRAEEATAEAKRKECRDLGMDGFVWHTDRGRFLEEKRLRDEIGELDKRLRAFDLMPIGNEATQEMLSAMRDDARRPLQTERDKLQKELDNIKPSRDRYRDEGCAQILKNSGPALPDKGPARR